jgi:hypothetical protein
MPWPQVGTRCRPNGWVRSAMPGRGSTPPSPTASRLVPGTRPRRSRLRWRLSASETRDVSAEPWCSALWIRAGHDRRQTTAPARRGSVVPHQRPPGYRDPRRSRRSPRHMAASSLHPRSGRSTCPPVDRLTCGVVDPWLSVVDSWSLMVRRPGAARILVPALAPPEGEGETGTPATACRCRAGGRPEAARRAGLEDVEKLLTAISSRD